MVPYAARKLSSVVKVSSFFSENSILLNVLNPYFVNFKNYNQNYVFQVNYFFAKNAINTVMFQIKAAFWVTGNFKTGINLENFPGELDDIQKFSRF